MARFKGLLFLGAGLVIGVLFGAGILFGLPAKSGAGNPPPPSTGKAVQDFQLSGSDGKSIRLSELKGKPVVINFWATWCPPCREEMPKLENKARSLEGKVVFLAIDDDEDASVVREYIQKTGVTFPVLLDPGGTINRLYYVESYPNTFFIDSEGILRALHIGQMDETILARNLEAVGVKP